MRIPVIWGPAHRQHAKLFYTLQALRRADLHTKVFDAIHQEGLPLAARDEVEARAMHFAFLNRERRVGEGFQRRLRLDVGGDEHAARRRTSRKNFAVASVPVMFVNGKYIDQRERGRRRPRSCSR